MKQKKRGERQNFEFGVQNTINVKSHTQSNQQLMKSQDFKKNSIQGTTSQHKTLQNQGSNNHLNIRKNSVDQVHNGYSH